MKWGVLLYNLVQPGCKQKNITDAQNKCKRSINLQHTF